LILKVKERIHDQFADSIALRSRPQARRQAASSETPSGHGLAPGQWATRWCGEAVSRRSLRPDR
jgi:hypothetical protein